MKTTVEIFTDGACQGNPGVGGWGALLRFDQYEKCLFGGAIQTTNNRMELTAAIQALLYLTNASKVILTTDSQYLRYGITQWIKQWQQCGWKTASRKAVKNRDLWQQLLAVSARHNINWRWVAGHSGHVDNDKADQLAKRGIALTVKRLGK